MRTDLEIRAKAATRFIEQQMAVSFKSDFFDAEREQYKTKAVAEFVATLMMVRDSTRADDNLAKAMAGAKI